jgi:hypothetical protein
MKEFMRADVALFTFRLKVGEMSFRDLGKLKHKLGPSAGVQLESLVALSRADLTADRLPRPYFPEHATLNKP